MKYSTSVIFKSSNFNLQLITKKGGILLNIVVCGALFRPLQWELEDESDSESDSSSSDDSDSTESSDSDYDASHQRGADTSRTLLLSEHKPAKPAPIASTESIPVCYSKDRLHRLSKNFSSDSCLDHNNNKSIDDEGGVYMDETRSVKSMSFLTKANRRSPRSKPRHRSMNLLGLVRTASVEDTGNNNNLEINFSKSAGSLNLYKSFLSFARTVKNKSSDECDLDREQLEEAGFLVVDADELVGCGEEDGIFFPFVTREENFGDQVNDNSNESEGQQSGEQAESGGDEGFKSEEINEGVEGARVEAEVGVDGTEVNFIHSANEASVPSSKNNNAIKNTSSIFAKFSEFFAAKRARTSNLNTSIGKYLKCMLFK
jgi:hypothetical protein